MTPLTDEIRLFAGTSHIELAKEIAHYLGLSLGKLRVSRFTGGEIYARVEENVRGQSIYIIQTATERVNEELMELLILLDAFKRSSAKSIAVVLPYFPYARQDKKSASREPISARLIADLLTTAGATRIITMDLHSDQIQGFFTVPLDHLTAMPLFANYIKEKKLKDIVVVAPDTGRARTAKKLGDRIGAELAILHKRRPHQQEAEVMNVIGDVVGKTCIIVDDMVDTAGTVSKAVETLRKVGAARDMYFVATHPILSGPAVERMEGAGLTEVVLTNSIPIAPLKRFDGLTILSVASLLGEAIKRNFENRSISSLFD